MSKFLDGPVAVAPDALAREIDGNFTIYDKQRDSVMVLNDSASAIWRLCDGRAGHKIVDELARRYETDREEIRRDVESVLVQLREKGLLVPNDASS